MDALTGSLIFGGLNTALGVAQGWAGNQAAQQDYLNQVAFADAQNEFAAWQSGFNARIQNANNQYQYWVEQTNYGQQLAYSKSQRNVELLKAVRQAEVVRDTRAAAGASYVRDSEAIAAAYSEASMQEAVALQQYQWRSLQARASVQAMATEGRSVDRLVNDYARQEGDYATLQDINKKIRERQYTRAQAGQVADYLSRWNSQTFYDEATVFDPLPPFAPLPALMTPAGPSMVGGAPSSAAAGLNIAAGVLGGVNSGLGMYSSLRGLQAPSGGSNKPPGGN